MFNNIFSYDEISARAYEAYQLQNAGYEDEARKVRRQTFSTAKLSKALRSGLASLFSHDEPSALAYETRQNAAAGYLPETSNDDNKPGFFEPTAWLNKPTTQTKTVSQLACGEC